MPRCGRLPEDWSRTSIHRCSRTGLCAVRVRCAASRRHHRADPDRARGAHGCGRGDFVDRLRRHRQPDADPRGRPLARDGLCAPRSAPGARSWFARCSLKPCCWRLRGGVFGVIFAYWATAALVRLAPVTTPRLHEIGVDARTLVFAVIVCCVTALLCGILPAVELSRRPSGEALKDGGRAGTASLRQRRIFGTLVTAQFAWPWFSWYPAVYCCAASPG